MTDDNKSLDLEIKSFENYCVDFYDDTFGIYPIATEQEIKEAIKVFLMINDFKGIEFDSVDREKVRTILNR